MSSDVSFKGMRGFTSLHQRCDAMRPCTACANEGKASRCTYEPRQRPRPTAAFQTLANKLSGPSGHFTTFDSSESNPSLPPSLTPCERPSLPTVRLPWKLSSPIDNQTGSGPSSDISVAHSIRGATECVSHLIGPSFQIPSPIRCQTTPQPLQVPLSLTPPERMQVPFLPTLYIPSSDAACITECAHDGENDPQSWGGYPLYGSDGHISRPGGAEPVKVPAVISAHSPSRPNLIPPTTDSTRVVTYEPPAPRVYKADHVLHGRSPGLSLAHGNPFKRRISLDSSPSISTISSFWLPTVPPEPRIPLSFLGEERLQVQFSETDATDLDMG